MAAPTEGYLRQFHQSAKKLLPPWLHDRLHSDALPRSGGLATRHAADGSRVQVAPADALEGPPADEGIFGGALDGTAEPIDEAALRAHLAKADLAHPIRTAAPAPDDANPPLDPGPGGWDDSFPMLVSLLARPSAAHPPVRIPLAQMHPMAAMDRAKVHAAAGTVSRMFRPFALPVQAKEPDEAGALDGNLPTADPAQPADLGTSMPTSGLDDPDYARGTVPVARADAPPAPVLNVAQTPTVGGPPTGPIPSALGPATPPIDPSQLYAPLDHPSLMAMYEAMQASLDAEGLQGQPVQGWMPHLLFGSSGSGGAGPSPWEEIPMGDWPVSSLEVAEGPTASRYPLGRANPATPTAKADGPTSSAVGPLMPLNAQLGLSPTGEDDDEEADGRRLTTVVKVVVPTRRGTSMAKDGGQLPENMHLTLAHLGRLAPAQRAAVHEAVAGVASRHPEFTARLSGIGRFHPTRKAQPGPFVGEAPGQDVVYASADHPDLPALYAALQEALTETGLPGQEHGFTPHVTLGTVPHGQSGTPWDGSQLGSLPVHHLTVGEGPTDTNYSLAAAKAVADGEPGQPVAKVEIGGSCDWAWVEKGEDDLPKYVCGPVYIPGQLDSQGDHMTTEDIEAMAHRFLVAYRKAGVQHSGEARDDIQVVESYVAPHEMRLGPKQKRVPAGTWIAGGKLLSLPIRQAVARGDLTGWSWQGYAVPV